jgi:hypothetical protein
LVKLNLSHKTPALLWQQCKELRQHLRHCHRAKKWRHDKAQVLLHNHQWLTLKEVVQLYNSPQWLTLKARVKHQRYRMVRRWLHGKVVEHRLQCL